MDKSKVDAVRSEADKVLDRVKRMKAQYLSMPSDQPDLIRDGQMRFKVKDHTFRDVYARGNLDTSSPKTIVWMIPTLAVILLQLMLLVLIPSILMMASPQAEGHYFKVILALYLMPLAGWIRSAFCIGISYALYKGIKVFAERYWESQNVDSDKTLLDNDEYSDASRIRQPEELAEDFDIFPDAGAHSKTTDVTAILGHIMLSNAGVHKIEMPLRAEKDEEIDGMEVHKNELLYDENDELVKVSKSMIDEKFGDQLWDSSLLPRPYGKNAGYIKKILRHRYDPDDLEYNPSKQYGKSKEATVAEKINNDWYMPTFEVQRPGGMYIVDTEPNNTMVLAMTRAGKGQSVINPTIDVWLRSDEQSNIVCNDPKGELYLSFYYVARKRGYRVLAFNLIEPSRTNIYNPLGYAVEAARKGDNRHVEEYVKTIGDVFFPPDKSEDPMWPNAANAAFQRSALGLIDYYMEEEHEIREKAAMAHWSTSQLNRTLDISWGHVTLYNVYQMMTQLAAKKSQDASLIHLDKDDQSDEKDFLTLFFDATAKLPTNALRTSVQNQDNSLRAMAGSDKTIASVYGISLTEIKFFADDNVSHLTSGRPSQNFDIMGMSFPRRFEVKLDSKYTKDAALRTQGYTWSAYSDKEFKKSLGKQFVYQNNISPDGWISYVTKAIFPNETSYLKLEIFEQATGLPMHTWYFKFVKNYQTTLDGRSFVVDPVSDERVVQDGYLTQIQRIRQKDGTYKFVDQPIRLKRSRVNLLENDPDLAVGQRMDYEVPLFEQLQVHYLEEPTIVFFITPPHLKSFARIILILINQMFNMQVSESYLTLPSQKPYFKTKYMLDEVGNLSSNGSGIPDLQTKASIGLAQGQQFTLILQTLAQLEDVYGKNINAILQGNVGNILYIKSTDDSMLQTLEQLSGKMYRIEHDSQTISNDMYKVINRTDGKLSQNRTVKEVPVITKNNMLQVTRGDLMVFGKPGGNPIWNTNQCAMPYAYQLLDSNPLQDFADPKKYTLRTVPTTANTMDFDLLNNIPNFMAMVAKRVHQAKLVQHKRELFKQNHFIHNRQLDDDDLSRMNVEQLSKEIMRAVNEQLAYDNDLKLSKKKKHGPELSDDDLKGSDTGDEPENVSDIADQVTVNADSTIFKGLQDSAEDNTEVLDAMKRADAQKAAQEAGQYANNMISKHDLKYNQTDDLHEAVQAGYVQCLDAFKHDNRFKVDSNNNLWMGDKLMIKNTSDDLDKLSDQFGSLTSTNEPGQTNDSSDDSSDFDLGGLMAGGNDSTDDSTNLSAGFQVEAQPAWFDFLAGLPDWSSLGGGQYDAAVASVYQAQEAMND